MTLADGLDPTNTSAFVTGLTFESDGTFTGTQTPITNGGAAISRAGILTCSWLMGWWEFFCCITGGAEAGPLAILVLRA